MNSPVGPICVLAFGLPLLCAAPTCIAEETTEQLYNRWVSTTGDNWEPGDSGDNDRLFVKLLQREDADLFLLRPLDGLKYRVRALSRIGLARLKTDRSFAVLEKEIHYPNPGVQLRALETLAEFRQPRCVPVLLDAFSNELYGDVSYKVGRMLAASPDEQVNVGLLKILKDPDKNAVYQERVIRAFAHPRGAEDLRRFVAASAAYVLGERQVDEAIDPTYGLIINAKSVPTIALDGLRRHRNKKVVPMFLDLMERWPTLEYEWRQLDPIIKWLPEKLARQTTDVLGPVPKTIQEWRNWWTKAEPLFTDDLRRKDLPAGAENKDPRELGSDPKQLVFRVSVDSQTYREADPIAIDLSMRNESSRPMRTIPSVLSGWCPTMAYGIRLERLGDAPLVILDSEPSPHYIGSYSGPPGFQTLQPGQTISTRVCMNDWFWWQTRDFWPLGEGRYRLTITFDNAEFAGVWPMLGELVHCWRAPVEFTVAGPPREDPEDLVRLISEKSGIRSLRSDLTNERRERREPAWLALRVWGDSRLTPLLSQVKYYDEYRDRYRGYFFEH